MKGNSKEKYITLKEAAEISGYTPDYVGQLIRKGKLPGKQVYCTVAWMTTEEAIKQYVQKSQNRKEKTLLQEGIFEAFHRIKARVFLGMKFVRLFRAVLYFGVVLSIGLSLVLFYIFSVSIEKRLEQKTIQRLEAQVIQIQNAQ